MVACTPTVAKLQRLYGNEEWELLIASVVAKFKFTKSRLVIVLSESEDTVIQTATTSVILLTKSSMA